MIEYSTSPVLIREGRCDSVAGWAALLDVDFGAIESLAAEGVFRKTGESADLRLDFVGLISTRQRTLFALPKICVFDAPHKVADLWRATASVQTYDRRRRRVSTAEAGDASFIDTGGTLLDLFLALLSWSLSRHIKEQVLST
jgi:hypothetical protein